MTHAEEGIGPARFRGQTVAFGKDCVGRNADILPSGRKQACGNAEGNDRRQTIFARSR
jgi:hypothetical protein